MAEDRAHGPEPYGSFDSARTAKLQTQGRIYECRGYEGHAIIVEDQSGRNWLYIRPESAKYRDAANAVWGHRMSADGKDADHVASRGIEAQVGQGYVLAGAVDRSANRSHGSYEKPGKYLDRPFNQAAQRTHEDRLALPLSNRQGLKVSGQGKREIEANSAFRARNADVIGVKGADPHNKKMGAEAVTPSVGDQAFDEATFGNPEHQKALERLKGVEIHADLKKADPPTTAQKYGGPRPWEQKVGAAIPVASTSEWVPKPARTGPGKTGKGR